MSNLVFNIEKCNIRFKNLELLTKSYRDKKTNLQRCIYSNIYLKIFYSDVKLGSENILTFFSF